MILKTEGQAEYVKFCADSLKEQVVWADALRAKAIQHRRKCALERADCDLCQLLAESIIQAGRHRDFCNDRLQRAKEGFSE